uniref:Uncharacterized protein n=1 Tax=Musa acuminata subsp. malaccensis TaxID=214687 RepID=A0A804HU78_MUSAM
MSASMSTLTAEPLLPNRARNAARHPRFRGL